MTSRCVRALWGRQTTNLRPTHWGPRRCISSSGTGRPRTSRRSTIRRGRWVAVVSSSSATGLTGYCATLFLTCAVRQDGGGGCHKDVYVDIFSCPFLSLMIFHLDERQHRDTSSVEILPERRSWKKVRHTDD